MINIELYIFRFNIFGKVEIKIKREKHMKIEHIAVASNTEQDADKFFIDLLGFEKTRNFTVDKELTEQFFGVKRDLPILRYASEYMDAEVLITEDDSKAKDIYTHSCILVGERDDFLDKAKQLGFETMKVPRADKGYYLFMRDTFGNLYEIKEIDK